jgi:hypothetical protein
MMNTKALLLVAFTACAGSAAAEPGDRCDRACLEALVDRYLDAVVAHDAARAPLEASPDPGAALLHHGTALPVSRSRRQSVWADAIASHPPGVSDGFLRSSRSSHPRNRVRGTLPRNESSSFSPRATPARGVRDRFRA